MDSETFNQKFKQINFLFMALFSGQVFVFVVAYWLVSAEGVEFNNSINETFRYLVPLFGVLVMLSSKMIYNKKIKSVENEKNVEIKLETYREAKVIVWAMIESAGLFSIVIFMITGNFYYTVVFILILGYFLLNKPGKENFIYDFKIPADESSKISG